MNVCRNWSEQSWFLQRKTFISDQAEVVKELIQKNPEILNTKIDGDGNIPVHFAVEHGAYH